MHLLDLCVVYHKGVEQPELKDTLEPTKVEKPKRIPKITKERLKRDALFQINKLRKQLNKTRFKKDKKVIEAQLKIERKIANGKFPKSFFDKYGK